jgi:hypothetical protein
LRIDRTTDAPPFWFPALQDSFDLAARRNRSYRALARLAPGRDVCGGDPGGDVDHPLRRRGHGAQRESGAVAA